MRSWQCRWHQRIATARRVLRDLTAFVVDLTHLVSAVTLLVTQLRLLIVSSLVLLLTIYLCMHIVR